MTIGRRMTREPILCTDSPGFLVNHIGRGMGPECQRILVENIASHADIDRIMTGAPGFRMGPFTLADLVGIDVNTAAWESMYAQFYQEPAYAPSPLSALRAAGGLYGQKTGAGWYSYKDGKKDEPPVKLRRQRRDRNRSGCARAITTPTCRRRCSSCSANSGVEVERGDKPSAEALIVITPVGYDLTTAIADLKYDAARTRRRRRAVRPQGPAHADGDARASTRRCATPRTASSARDGQPVIVINDSPGFVAQRAVAMLVNVGCNIAQRGIGVPADIDKGAKLGLGYPFGPIEWGDRIGPKRVLFILERLQAFYQEPRYRPSPWLKRRVMLGLPLSAPEQRGLTSSMSFERLFNPRGIAVVGASGDLTRISGQPIAALKNSGYKGGIYLVNPKYQELHGLKCYPAVDAIGQPCDLALVAVPAPGVPAAIRDCGKAGIPFAIVLTAGFREAGAEGRKLEAELARAAKESRRALHRPQLPGHLERAVAHVVRVRQRQPRNRAEGGRRLLRLPVRRLRLCRRQSRRGAGHRLPARRLDRQRDRHHDAGAAVGIPRRSRHQSWRSPTWKARPMRARLLDVGRKSLETGKPVLIWKGAQTEAGTKAAASHTANLTGNYDLYRAAFRQSGIIEVHDIEEIVDIAKLFAQGRTPKGRSVGVLSISGGSGIVFADRAVKEGLTLPELLRRDGRGAARHHSDLRLVRESGRHHGRRVQRSDAVLQDAGDRAGRSRHRSALRHPGLDQRPGGRQGLPGDRRRRRDDRQAGARRLVRPQGQVGSGLEPARQGQYPVHHHAGAHGARGRRARQLRRRPAPPATAHSRRPAASTAEVEAAAKARSRCRSSRARPCCAPSASP